MDYATTTLLAILAFLLPMLPLGAQSVVDFHTKRQQDIGVFG